MSERKLWLAWFFLVFGLFNLYGPDPESLRRPSDPPGMSESDLLARLSRPELVLEVLRDDSDARRYYAYARAMLGRPAPHYFIRPADRWRELELSGAAPAPGETEAGRGLRPWRDFSLEYPPAMPVFILAPALFSPDFSTFQLLFNLEMEILLTLAVWFGVRTAERMRSGLGRSALGWSLAATAALGIVAVRRFDAVLAFSVAAAFHALLTRRMAFAGAAWAGGVAAKGAPLVLGPLALIWLAREGDYRGAARAAAGAALTLFAFGAAFLAIAGPHWSDPFAYHALRPLQFESLYGGVLVAARFLDPAIASTVYSFGSDSIVSAYEPALGRVAAVAPVLAVAAITLWAFLVLRRTPDAEDRFGVLLAAACACLVAFATLGKVFSPQYLVWLIPLGPLAALRAGALAGKAMIAAFALTQFEYPFLYHSLNEMLDPRFGLIVLARNALLWGWIALLLRALWRSGPIAPPAR
jgi:hypothetical protein